MKTWAGIMATNARIKSRICPASSDHSKFAMLTNKLLSELANILGDYIVDRRIDKNREKGLIEAFEVYFTQLTNTPKAALSALVYYMAAVKMLADVFREEESLISAKKREVVMAGQILGSKMDSIFL
jgi:hypothetical protein